MSGSYIWFSYLYGISRHYNLILDIYPPCIIKPILTQEWASLSYSYVLNKIITKRLYLKRRMGYCRFEMGNGKGITYCSPVFRHEVSVWIQPPILRWWIKLNNCRTSVSFVYCPKEGLNMLFYRGFFFLNRVRIWNNLRIPWPKHGSFTLTSKRS